MLFKFEAEAKSLRLRPNGPKAEARGYEVEAKVCLVASLALRL